MSEVDELNKTEQEMSGAACQQILSDQFEFALPPNTETTATTADEILVKDDDDDDNNNDDNGEFPLPPPLVMQSNWCEDEENRDINFNNNDQHSFSQYSTTAPQSSHSPSLLLLNNQNNQSLSTFNRNDRAPSLPNVSAPNQNGRRLSDNFKKHNNLELSRRSSVESAYHSHASDQSPRTHSVSSIHNISSQQLFLHNDANNSNNFNNNIDSAVGDSTDTNYDLNNQSSSSFLEDVSDQNYGNFRRDSLSYEAIRDYFLYSNPYQEQQAETIPIFSLCPENHPTPRRDCPFCRRQSIFQRANIQQFRTEAHREVIEHQFEELFNIPNPRTSRSTSIELFDGMSADQIEHLNDMYSEACKDTGDCKDKDDADH